MAKYVVIEQKEDSAKNKGLTPARRHPGGEDMVQKTSSYIGDFDPHFKIFHEMMAFKVREILLVSSPYDAYIMEEDGSMASRIINEYHGLNLSQPPRITRVSTGEQALELLKRKRFDLVVTMPHLGGMDGCTFGNRVKEIHYDIPVILLSHSLRDTDIRVENALYPCIDKSYVWCCDSDIMLAIVKSVEDEHNVDIDTRKANVRVILLVEDSALYRSRILPILYGEVVQQTQSVLDEGLNEKHRLLKMRARPKILTAGNYEDALALFNRYRPYIFSVMSDVRFPRDGVERDSSGVELLQEIRRQVPDMPLLMLSTDPANRELAKSVPAVFLEKTSSSIQEEIHDFFLRYLGFGDFVFCMPDGTRVGRAGNLHTFENLLKTVPIESVVYHAHHNHFSNWVMARAEVALAARLHKQHFTAITDGEELREDIVFKVHALRKLRQQGVVTRFIVEDFDPRITDFVQIGKGSMGGKARGIAFVASQLRYTAAEHSALAENKVRIPRTCVIATDGFDAFVEENKLVFQEGESDEVIARRFLDGDLPEWLFHDLEAYLAHVDYPLSVRSSSLLEDAQFRPYAGLYNTFMLVNADSNFSVRLQQLIKAIKLVYASTWFENPRAYSRSIGQTREDSMAVIIQQLAGSRYGDAFYPAVSGVAQSYNYYPVSPMRSEDGIAHVALGFGKTVVEGETSLRFSPSFPKNLPQFSTVDDILANSQRRFYSLDCSDTGRFQLEDGNLLRREVNDAADEYPVGLLSSTYLPEEHRIRDAVMPGQKVLTFAPILKYDLYPLPKLLTELLALGREGMGCEVEIEFAVDLGSKPGRSTFYFLQIRPIVTGSELRQVQIGEKERNRAFLRSKRALGHGLYQEIRDIVFVRPEQFDAHLTREIAREISRINGIFDKEQKPYLLMGPGRWGTADPWLGIPVQWGDISRAGVIIEMQNSSLRAEPSQGSHFFQNITSLGIPYLIILDEQIEGSQEGEGELVNWDVLHGLEVIQEEQYIVHARLPEGFVLKVDGHTSEAVGFV